MVGALLDQAVVMVVVIQLEPDITILVAVERVTLVPAVLEETLTRAVLAQEAVAVAALPALEIEGAVVVAVLGCWAKVLVAQAHLLTLLVARVVQAEQQVVGAI